MKRFDRLPAVTALLCVLAACGSEGDEAEGEALEPSPLPVTASIARVDTLYEVLNATGRVESRRSQTLTAQIQGQVIQAPLYDGAPFSAGDVIFRVSSGEYSANLAAASGAHRSAQVLYQFECDNYQGELTEDVRQMLRQTTGLDQAQATLSRAGTQYSNSAIRAGFDGVVASVSVHEGMTVYPGTLLGELVDPQSLQVRVEMDERQLARCVQGSAAFVTIPSLGDTTLAGMVFSVSPVVNPSYRAGTVMVDLPFTDNLRPGATARVEIVVSENPGALVIPEEAILIRDNRTMVFLVEDGKAKWIYVTVGARGRGTVSITEGITEGDQVITGGHYSLAHDAPVAVMN